MTRGQWTLAGLLLVQLTLIAVLRQPASAGASEAHPLVADLDPASITKIEVTGKEGERLVAERSGPDWKIATADGYPADGTKVSDVLDTISDATVRSPVVTSSKYHESLEVTESKAGAHVRLYAGADDAAADLFIGKTTTGGAHVRLAGDEEVYDVRDLSPWDVRPDTATWMQRKLVDVPFDSVTRLTVSNEHGIFDLMRVDGEWQVASPAPTAGSKCAKDKIDPIIRAVASLNVAGAAGRLDPKTQGLGDDAITVTLGYGEGSVTVRIGGPVPDKSGHVYVTRDGFGFAATHWETSLNSVKNAKIDELLE